MSYKMKKTDQFKLVLHQLFWSVLIGSILILTSFEITCDVSGKMD